MVLTKEELISSIANEVRVLLHLISKVEPGMLDYKPALNQRTLVELLRYLVVMAPVHVRGATGKAFDMEAWRAMWNAEEGRASTMDLEQIREAIAKQPAVCADVINACPDEDLRGELEMFGSKASRGSWLVRLLLSHYAAYRMQLFLYLKACGRPELSTMNLWVGTDAARP
jgi:hypothetical protein